jgi:hypothetical protein
MWLMYLGLFIGVYSFYSHELFEKTMALRNFNVDDVAAGREYIEAYVQFFRYAEGEEEVNTEKDNQSCGHGAHSAERNPDSEHSGR